MTKYMQIQTVIERMFQDGKSHDIKEVRSQCAAAGIDVFSDKNAVNNVIFKMKKSGYLQNGEEKGVYWLTSENRPEKGTEPGAKEEEKEAPLPRLDWNRFFVLKPQSRQYQEMKLVIHPKGEIRLNAHLQKKLQNRRIEIILSKDYQYILLNPQGANAHEFTKAGTVKNREIVELLKKARIPLPVSYRVYWSEQYDMWEGKIEISEKK